MAFEWKKLVSNIAPIIGSALGGPLGGIATKFIADRFLGNPDASEAEINDALSVSSPEQLVQLKALDHEFAIKMKKLDIDIQRVNSEDRHSARLREILAGDNVPSFLAFLVTIGFFGILSIIMFYPVQSHTRELVDIMLGSLGTVWITAMAYYFGSSQKANILLKKK